MMIITYSLGFRPGLSGVAYAFFVVLIVFFMVYGISLFLSIVMVKVRDLTHIIDLLFQLLFWGSAVFFSIDDIHGTTGDVIRLNPLAILIDAARKGFVLGQISHVNEIMFISIGVVVLVFLGQIYFNKKIKRVAEFF